MHLYHAEDMQNVYRQELYFAYGRRTLEIQTDNPSNESNEVFDSFGRVSLPPVETSQLGNSNTRCNSMKNIA